MQLCVLEIGAQPPEVRLTDGAGGIAHVVENDEVNPLVIEGVVQVPATCPDPPELAAPAALGTIAVMRIAISVVPLVLLCAAAPCPATPLGAGMRMSASTLTDQHDVEGSVRPDTRCVLFSRDMNAAKIVQEALGNDPAALIAPAGAVIVSDISGMPSLITKLFALPALRKRPYRILLDREGTVTADFPAVKGKVTVLYLTDFTVERVEYVDSADALRAALRQAAEPQQDRHADGGDR